MNLKQDKRQRSKYPEYMEFKNVDEAVKYLLKRLKIR